MTTTLATEQPPHPVTRLRRLEIPGGLADRECALILMSVTEHADDSADEEVLPELAEHGLRHYTARIAGAVDVGPEAAWCEWADAPSAYIALDQKLPDHPDRDAALIWAAERGWAVAVETGCGEDLLITASLNGDVLPAPETVATWFHAVLAGKYTGAHRRPNAAVDTDVIHRLTNWAGQVSNSRRSDRLTGGD